MGIRKKMVVVRRKVNCFIILKPWEWELKLGWVFHPSWGKCALNYSSFSKQECDHSWVCCHSWSWFRVFGDTNTSYYDHPQPVPEQNCESLSLLALTRAVCASYGPGPRTLLNFFSTLCVFNYSNNRTSLYWELTMCHAFC